MAQVLMGTTNRLIDLYESKMEIVERKTGGLLRVRGEFARSDVATENKRVYPSKLWEDNIKRLKPRMEDMKVYGELDHPDDGKTKLARASHLVTSLELRDDGVVVGEAVILNTRMGKDLQAIIEGGGKVGVSSRGYGSVKANEKNEQVVQGDYKLATFDFVADPADSTAYPEVVFEGVEFSGNALEEVADSKTKDELARELLQRVESVKAEVRERVRQEMLNDPEVAAARKVLDEIKTLVRPFVLPADAEMLLKEREDEVSQLKGLVAEQELRIRELQDDLDKMTRTAKKVGYKFFLEQQLAGDKDAALLRQMVGDVERFESAKNLEAALEAARRELKAVHEREQERLEAERRAAAAMKTQVEDLQAQLNELQDALEEQAEANKALALRLYVEKKLTNHPRAAKIRTVLESANPQTRQAVDELFEGFDEPRRDNEQLGSLRSRVRQLTRGGFADNKEINDDEAPNTESGGRSLSEDYNGLGVPLGDLKKLSGLNGKSN